MKTSISLICSALFLAPLTVSACPGLAGRYDCGGMGTILTVTEGAKNYGFDVVTPFSSNPGAVQGGFYQLSKTGRLSSSLEGVGGKSLDVISTCEGDQALRLDADLVDAVAGPAHMTKRIFKDAYGTLHKVTEFTFANGSTRAGDEVLCGAQ